MSDATQYPDLAPDGLGELKSIKRISGMKAIAPKIRWGDEYNAWPVDRRLDYAERLASAMNHAADVLQQERGKLLDVAKHQETLLEDGVAKYLAQGELMHRELGRANEQQQQLNRLIVQLQAEIKEKTHRIRELQSDGDYD